MRAGVVIAPEEARRDKKVIETDTGRKAMTEIEGMAGAILDQIDADPGVKEFKRTVQHDDGTTETFRVDVTEISVSHFVAASVRQRGEGGRRESGPREFLRDDRRGFAAWLAGDPNA